MEERGFLRNTALLTGAALFMRCTGIWFQVWLAGRIGADGIGLYTLTLSVVALAATVAISGIRFASTRLVSEQLGAGRADRVGPAMRRALRYALCCGAAAALALLLLAERAAESWIGDTRTASSLRIAALSLPCVSLSAALSGYFTACGRIGRPTLIHLLEQLAGFAFTALLLRGISPASLERCCAVLTAGRTAADLLCLLLMAAAYRGDRKRHGVPGADAPTLRWRLLRLALPLALSAYARSALTTLQHLLVPRGLRAAGFAAERALAGYGVIQGMALPLLLFPSCVLSAATELIVPRLTAAQVRGEARRTKHTAGELCRLSLLYSLAVSLFLYLYAEKLGIVLYDRADAGQFIRALAPLIPVMYTDMAVDGCLRGLGQQTWSMAINILDALVGLFLLYRLLPRHALSAYIGVLYATELLNFALSLWRLLTALRSSPAKAAQR